MRQRDAERIASRLTEYYGLPLAGKWQQEDEGRDVVELSPEGVHANDGFRVRVSLGWRSLRGEFIPGSYAGPMIGDMGQASEAEKAVFTGLIDRMQQENGTVQMQINSIAVDPTNVSDWPDRWDRLSLTVEKSPLAVNTEDEEDTEKAVLHWGGRFVAAIIALAPLEEMETEEDANPEGLPEGAKTRVEVNKYERSRFNRAACIEIQGDHCKACGFDFSAVYGALGKGFIHVHHVVPVSAIGADYKINPAEDLVPLCPNCHAMVHKEIPPLGVDDLIRILGES